MKFAYLFLILTILSMPAFANNSKYDVDFDYALEHYQGKEFDRYLSYQRKITRAKERTHTSNYYSPISRMKRAWVRYCNDSSTYGYIPDTTLINTNNRLYVQPSYDTHSVIIHGPHIGETYAGVISY